ncbi:MAG: type IV secretory system conjugative DNA transfer family protein, partial [Bacteroidota bacterium]
SLEIESNREAASIKSTARKWTDFLKSPLLRRSLEDKDDNFDPNILSEGNTTLYIVIPADKLESHGAWLRLVVGACMKAVIRQPKKDVQFILDEFYALGYMPMVETAMGAYSGYGVRVWAIIQSLTQLRKLYGEEGWENFIGNASVLHAFGINDNFTADYISRMTGEMSFPSYGNILGLPTGATPRNVYTSAQVRNLNKEILLFVDRKSVAKIPYKEYWPKGVWPELLKASEANPLL